MTTTIAKPSTPNLDKMLEVKTQSQTIGEFLEWLKEQRYLLGQYLYHVQDAQYDECYGVDDECPWQQHNWHHETFAPAIGTGTQRLLARYYGIDLEAMNAEREELLEHLRRLNP